MPVTLRPALAADYDAIAEIWHSSAGLPTVGPAVLPPLATMRQRVDIEFAEGWVVTVAVRNGEIAGFVALKPREAVLDQLFIRPGAIGGGIGRALLDHAKAAMPGGFELFTRTGNDKARRFYEKAGLVAFREGVHPTSGDPIVHYRWGGA